MTSETLSSGPSALHAAAVVRDGRSSRAESRSSDDGTASPKSTSTKYSFYYATALQSLLHPPVIGNRTESRVLVISDQPPPRASLLGGNVASIRALKSQLAPSLSSTPEPQSEPGRRTSTSSPSRAQLLVYTSVHYTCHVASLPHWSIHHRWQCPSLGQSTTAVRYGHLLTCMIDARHLH